MTISKYIKMMEDAFLIEEAKKYDIKGKKYMKIPVKYYFVDMGLRNAKIEFREVDEVTHIMENIIYNELRMRGYTVNVGNLSIVENNKKM